MAIPDHSHCQRCGAVILWALHSRTGTVLALAPDHVVSGYVIVGYDETGRAVVDLDVETGVAHQPHECRGKP